MNFSKSNFIVPLSDEDVMVKLRNVDGNIVYIITDKTSTLTLSGRNLKILRPADNSDIIIPFISVAEAREAMTLLDTALAKARKNRINLERTYAKDNLPLDTDDVKAVILNQIWTQSNIIPNSAPTGFNPVLEKVVDLPLVWKETYRFAATDFHDIVPPDFGDGSYAITIKTAKGQTIPSDFKAWYVNLETEELIFQGGFTYSDPLEVNENAPPTITFWKYTGLKGAVLPSSASPAFAWRLPAINFIDGITNSTELNDALLSRFDVYINTTFTYQSVTYTAGEIWTYSQNTFSWEKVTVEDGNRWVVSNLRDLTGVTSINDSYGTIIPYVNTAARNSIIEYWNGVDRGIGTNTGWVISYAVKGWYINLYVNNNVYRFEGSSWQLWIFNPIILTLLNKNMPALVTANDGDLATNVILFETPAFEGYVIVVINGVENKVGNGWDGTAAANFESIFARAVSTVQSNTNNDIVFTDIHRLSVNDSVLAIDGTGVHVCTVTTVVSSTEIIVTPVNPSPSYTFGTITSVWQHREWKDVVAGDMLLWFPSYAGYNLDADDRIDYNYITIG